MPLTIGVEITEMRSSTKDTSNKTESGVAGLNIAEDLDAKTESCSKDFAVPAPRGTLNGDVGQGSERVTWTDVVCRMCES